VFPSLTLTVHPTFTSSHVHFSPLILTPVTLTPHTHSCHPHPSHSPLMHFSHPHISHYHSSQVGKTGAWLLMVRLLHDHLRSSQGVVVENPPASSSIFLSRTSEGDEVPLLTNSVPMDITSPSYSPIVPLEYLQSVARDSCEENDRKPDIALLKDSPQSTWTSTSYSC